MQLYLHPTQHEALTANGQILTRWSLTTNPATILAQYSTTLGSLFRLLYDPGGRLHAYGGVTGSPDGTLFAMQQLQSRDARDATGAVIEWRHWDDLTVARASVIPQMHSETLSLAASPDGRWLVLGVGNPERIFLLDWQTGELVSHHAVVGYSTSGLAFDPTSTFLAAFSCHDNWGHCMLWRLEPAERFRARPQGMQQGLQNEWWAQDAPPDQVIGGAALSVVHWELDRAGIEWPYRDLADTACQAVFSPDSRMIIFNPMNAGYSGFGLELVVYEVASGKQLWWTRSQEEPTGPFIVSPDGATLLVPVRGSDLLVYRMEDGELMQRLPTGLNDPIQAIAYDHDYDSVTLWLATEGTLVQYQP